MQRAFSTDSPSMVFRSSHNGTTDVLRLLAASVVVLFHAGAAPGFTSVAAVGFFAAIMVFYTLKTLDEPGSRHARYASRRTKRLLVPWLVWSAIFAAVNVAQASVHGTPVVDEFRTWLPHIGTQGHLWYLPWAALVTVLVVSTRPWTRQWPLSVGSTLVAIAATSVLCLWLATLLPGAFRLGVLYLPAVAIGYAAYAFRNDPHATTYAMALSVIVGAALIIADVTGAGLFLLAAPCAFAVLTAKAIPIPGAHVLGAMALPVYLAHPLFIGVARLILPGVDNQPIVTGVFALSCSLLLALALTVVKGHLGAVGSSTRPSVAPAE